MNVSVCENISLDNVIKFFWRYIIASIMYKMHIVLISSCWFSLSTCSFLSCPPLSPSPHIPRCWNHVDQDVCRTPLTGKKMPADSLWHVKGTRQDSHFQMWLVLFESRGLWPNGRTLEYFCFHFYRKSEVASQEMHFLKASYSTKINLTFDFWI